MLKVTILLPLLARSVFFLSTVLSTFLSAFFSSQALAVDIRIPSIVYPSPYTNPIIVDGPGPHTVHILSGGVLSVPLNNALTFSLFSALTGNTLVNIDRGSVVEVAPGLSGFAAIAIMGSGMVNPTDTFTANVGGILRTRDTFHGPALVTQHMQGTLTLNLLAGGSIGADVINAADKAANFIFNIDSGIFDGNFSSVWDNVAIINIVPGAHFTTTGTFSTMCCPNYMVNNFGNLTVKQSMTDIETFTNASAAVLNINGLLSTETVLNQGVMNLNPDGTLLFDSFVNNGSFNAYGGQFYGPIYSGSPNSSVNFYNDYYLKNGIFGVGTVSVNNPNHILIVASPVVGYQNFQILNGAAASVFPGGKLIGNGPILIGTNATLILSGGDVQGNIVGKDSSMLLLNQDFSTTGSISGVTTIFNNGKNFTINHPISGFTTFINKGVVNLNAGGLPGSMIGNGPGSVLNVNHSFATQGILGVVSPLGTININNAALIMQNTVNTGVLNNMGMLVLPSSQVLNGNYYQGDNAVFVSNVIDENHYGQLQVNGSAIVCGKILLNIQGDGFNIQDQDFFDLIVANNVTLDPPTLIAPSSLFLSFGFDADPNVQSNRIRIRAKRSLFQQIDSDPAILGLSTLLDRIRKDMRIQGFLDDLEMRQILLRLEQSKNFQIVRENLSQLIPIVNGQEAIPSLYTPFLVFNEIDHHNKYGNSEFTSTEAHTRHVTRGYSAGDDLTSNYGPLVFGNYMKQPAQGLLDGFHARTAGVGAFAEQWWENCLNLDAIELGAALSYANTRGKSSIHYNPSEIKSVQGTLYGAVFYNGFYSDLLLALAQNRYHLIRHIDFLSRSATSHFHGFQSAERLRVGFDIPTQVTLQVSPEVAINNTHLNQKQYHENGAGRANLTVLGRGLNASQVNYGFRLYETSCPQIFLSEIHIFAIREIKNPILQLTSQFTGFGPAFVARAPRLARTAVNIGGSLTWIPFDYTMLVGCYDVERRHKLHSQSVSLRFKMMF